jgi:cytochrome c553
MNLKYKIFLIVFFSIFFVVGCGDEVKKEKKNVQSKKPTQSIEIVANENAKEIKVKEKNDTSKSNAYYYDYNVKKEYDSNAKPANSDASVRVKPRTSVDANIHVRTPYENIQVSLLIKKLSKTFRVKCSACHDDYANGIIGPSLLSRNSDYIYEKITEFRSGKKNNPLMDDLIKQMSKEEIRALADEIYEFNKQIKQMKEKQ